MASPNSTSITSKLSSWWHGLRPEKRNNITLVLFIVGVLVIVTTLWKIDQSGKKPIETTVAPEAKSISALDPQTLEKAQSHKLDEALLEIDRLKKGYTSGTLPTDPNAAGSGASPTTPGSAPNTPGPFGSSPTGISAPTMPAFPATNGAASASIPKLSGPSIPLPPMPGAATPLQPMQQAQSSIIAPPPPMPRSMKASKSGGVDMTPGNSGLTPPGAVPPPPGASDVAFSDMNMGGIQMSKHAVEAKDSGAVKEAGKKKERKSIYLPPSFVRAVLLSGLNAPTSEGGKGNPTPVLIRLQGLSILPNEVTKNLKGCFVIAEGVGNLADERAHIRLVGISCLSRRGEAVIDQKIKGYAVDADGQVGLAGKVVSRMGAVIARTALAAFISGVGEGVANSTQTSMLSPYGTTTAVTNFDPKNIALSGFGKGISESSKELNKFFLDLAKQSIPVVSVGASKEITIVFSEGTTLEIKDLNEMKGICCSL